MVAEALLDRVNVLQVIQACKLNHLKQAANSGQYATTPLQPELYLQN